MNSYSLSTITTGSSITVKGCDYTVPPISCGPNQQILNNGKIKYGRWDNSVCPPVNTKNPSNYTIYSLPNRCVGQNSCVLGTTNGLVDLPDPYNGTVKHFEITYNCGYFPTVTNDNSIYVENTGCDTRASILICPKNQFIASGSIKYGRWDNTMCAGTGVTATTPTSFVEFNLPPVCLKSVNNCGFGGSTDLFIKTFGDPLPGVFKQVRYKFNILSIII